MVSPTNVYSRPQARRFSGYAQWFAKFCVSVYPSRLNRLGLAETSRYVSKPTKVPSVQIVIAKKKKAIWDSICIIISLFGLFILTGGIFFEHFARYLPSEIKSTGKFKPKLTPTVTSKRATIVPFLMYYVSVKPAYSISFNLTDTSYLQAYDQFKYVTFNSFIISYSNGQKQEVIPGNTKIQYYSTAPNGDHNTQSFIPSPTVMERKKFIVYNSSEGCYGLIGPIMMTGKGNFSVIVKGRYVTHDGVEEEFYYEANYSQENLYQFNTGWNLVGSC